MYNNDPIKDVLREAEEILRQSNRMRDRKSSQQSVNFENLFDDRVEQPKDESKSKEEADVNISVKDMVRLIDIGCFTSFREVNDSIKKECKYNPKGRYFFGSKGTITARKKESNLKDIAKIFRKIGFEEYCQALMILYIEDENKLYITNNSSISVKINVDAMSLMDAVKHIHSIYVDMMTTPFREKRYPELYSEDNILKVKFYSKSDYKNCYYGLEEYDLYDTNSNTEFLYKTYMHHIECIYDKVAHLMMAVLSFLLLLDGNKNAAELEKLMTTFNEYNEWCDQNNFFVILNMLNRIRS